jgi:hypothetical protein
LHNHTVHLKILIQNLVSLNLVTSFHTHRSPLWKLNVSNGIPFQLCIDKMWLFKNNYSLNYSSMNRLQIFRGFSLWSCSPTYNLENPPKKCMKVLPMNNSKNQILSPMKLFINKQLKNLNLSFMDLFTNKQL